MTPGQRMFPLNSLAATKRAPAIPEPPTDYRLTDETLVHETPHREDGR